MLNDLIKTYFFFGAMGFAVMVALVLFLGQLLVYDGTKEKVNAGTVECQYEIPELEGMTRPVIICPNHKPRIMRNESNIRKLYVLHLRNKGNISLKCGVIDMKIFSWKVWQCNVEGED